MSQFIHLLRWEAILLVRNKLLQVSLTVTVLYMALFQLLKLLGNTELFAILLTLNDPALIGMLFVAVTIIFERESGSLQAVMVSPASIHAYLCAKLASLSLLGTACGWAMAMALVGFHIHHIGFLAACLFIAWLFGCLGIILVARRKRFVDFMLPMAGTLALMCLPLLDWFGIVPIPLKWVFPIEHGIRWMAWSFHFRVHGFPWLSLLTLLAVNALAYAWAFRRFSHAKEG